MISFREMTPDRSTSEPRPVEAADPNSGSIRAPRSSFVARVAIVLFTVWALVALYRASVWTLTRPDLDPKLPIRAWSLGGPQIEELRTFLETVVEPNAAPESLVVIRPQVDHPQDSIVLGAISAYLLPRHRVLHIGQYVALPIETEQPRYVVLYPGTRDLPLEGARLVERSESGALLQIGR